MCFNVELEFELYCINEVVGEVGVKVFIFLCINLDVDVKIYFYILIGLKVNKFGIVCECVLVIYELVVLFLNLNVVGMDCYIGF